MCRCKDNDLNVHYTWLNVKLVDGLRAICVGATFFCAWLASTRSKMTACTLEQYFWSVYLIVVILMVITFADDIINGYRCIASLVLWPCVLEESNSLPSTTLLRHFWQPPVINDLPALTVEAKRIDVAIFSLCRCTWNWIATTCAWYIISIAYKHNACGQCKGKLLTFFFCQTFFYPLPPFFQLYVGGSSVTSVDL